MFEVLCCVVFQTGRRIFLGCLTTDYCQFLRVVSQIDKFSPPTCPKSIQPTCVSQGKLTSVSAYRCSAIRIAAERGRRNWMGGEKYAQLSCRWVRRSGRVDDVGESGGTVDDLYMFDGIADGSREALVGKVGFCGLGGDQRHPHGRRYAARFSGRALLSRVPDLPQQLTTLFRCQTARRRWASSTA